MSIQTLPGTTSDVPLHKDEAGELPFYIAATGSASGPHWTLKHDDTFAVVDGVGDIGAGLFYTVMASVVVDQYPKPVPVDWPESTTFGYFDQSVYAARGALNDDPGKHDGTEGYIPFDPPAWRFEDPENVPPGLELAAREPDPTGGWVRITGFIPQSAVREEPYKFQLSCVNLYDPNITCTIDLSLRVTG